MGYYPQESLYKPYKYHGYTVRGTLNCPLISTMDIPVVWKMILKKSKLRVVGVENYFKPECELVNLFVF